MEKALLIDVQHTSPESFPNGDRKRYLREIKERNIPVHIALTPYQRERWIDLEDDIEAIASRPGSGLLLEGLLHVCSRRNHAIRDPHHEHICTSFLQSSADYYQQFSDMMKGFSFLRKIYGIAPSGFVPPQHLWNADTLKAVSDSDMQYLITNAMSSNMYPYLEGGVTIVPSGSMKHGRTENLVLHIYYDWIQRREDYFKEAIENAVPISNIPVKNKSSAHSLNNFNIRLAKQLRDAKRLANHLFKGTNYKSVREIKKERRKAFSCQNDYL